MFSYDLPNGGLHTKTFVTKEGQIKFDPALYEQRYTTTVRIIEDPRWRQSLKKVVDFGCSEMRLIPLLRRIPKVEHILAAISSFSRTEECLPQIQHSWADGQMNKRKDGCA